MSTRTTNILNKRWRIGGHYAVNVYTDELNRDDSIPVMQATSAELAAHIVAAHNVYLETTGD